VRFENLVLPDTTPYAGNEPLKTTDVEHDEDPCSGAVFAEIPIASMAERRCRRSAANGPEGLEPYLEPKSVVMALSWTIASALLSRRKRSEWKLERRVARHANRPFSIERADLEAPRNNEVLVKIHGVGLCHTDLIARSQFHSDSLTRSVGPRGRGYRGGGRLRCHESTGRRRVVLGFSSCGACAPVLKTAIVLSALSGIKLHGRPLGWLIGDSY